MQGGISDLNSVPCIESCILSKQVNLSPTLEAGVREYFSRGIVGSDALSIQMLSEISY